MIYLIEPNKETDGHFHLYLQALLTIPNTKESGREIDFKDFAGYSSIKKLSYIYKSIKTLLTDVPKGNVAHVLYSDIYYKFPFIFSGFLKRNKTIVTMHSCPNGRVKHLLIRNFCNRMNAVIVHSPFIQKKMIDMGVKNVHVVHYPSFYDYKSIGTKESVRAKFGIDESKIVISALGVLREDKGIDLLLESFKHVADDIKKNVILNIAGKPVDFSEKDLIELSQKYNVKTRLTIRMLSDQEFMENVLISDYMVFPYRKHMTANSGPMTEAMVNRIPTIVPADTNLSDIALTHSTGVTFIQEDVESLGKTIEQCLIKKPELSYDIADELTVSRFVQRHAEIYSQI